ncbi:MAG: major facilitator superfamily 1 [Actinomycetia bacterium]|nr:major facilitator superfamily 1 [Actinomycetes bacterium]
MNTARATFKSLHVRNFRLFFLGQLLSQCGTWMQTIALGWLVLHLSHNSGFAIGLVIALQFIPTLLFGVWGGWIADRFDKRTVLLCTQVAMAAIATLLAVLDLTNTVQLGMIYVIVFVFGLALAVDNPTRQSFVPELVPPADLPNAIGLSSAIFQLSRILGPALAGVLIVTVGTGICFALNAVSFVFIIGALLMMRTRELHRGAPVARDKGQIRDGLRYVWRTPELRSTLLLTLIVGTFAINSPVVLPLLAKITFHGDAAVYSWMTIAMGAGALVGALAVANKGDAGGNLLFGTGMVFGVAICAASLAPSLGIFIGLLLIVGAGQISFLSTCNSLLQLTSDPRMRGRVMAVYTITLLGSTPIGGPLVGWVSEQYGPRWGLAVGGIATIAGVLFFGTAFVRARRRDTDAAAAESELVRGPDGESIPAAIS